MDKINELRRKIDEIDDEIMSLLDKRFFITKEVGEVKKTISKDVFDPNREKNIFIKTSNFSHYPEIKSIYEHIMNVSKSQQRK